MLELVHHSTQALELHLNKLNKVQTLYLSKSFDFDSGFDDFLQELLVYFRAKGNTTCVSEAFKIHYANEIDLYYGFHYLP